MLQLSTTSSPTVLLGAVTTASARRQPPVEYVLEFDGTPMTVDGGNFWPADVPLGHFFWEVRAQALPNPGVQYLISDGYGGAHSILFGLRADGLMTGNVWDGTKYTSFGSTSGAKADEWATLAVGWDGDTITCYYNGMPAGTTPYAGKRFSGGAVNGGGHLFVGGSDHLNFKGRIAWVKGYEDASGPNGAPNLWYDFSKAEAIVRDLSNGYRGSRHDGRLRGVSKVAIVECPECPRPKYVRAVGLSGLFQP